MPEISEAAVEAARKEIAEFVEAWVECPHLSHDGTGNENEWRCMGCGQIEQHTPDPDGDIWTKDGRFRSEVVLDPDPVQCANNMVRSVLAAAAKESA